MKNLLIVLMMFYQEQLQGFAINPINQSLFFYVTRHDAP